ncbi:MAG: sodium/panthothenate symporter [Lentisphaerae bacterium ADurb.Bin082]|nr:MAG: sodium/panthothenate symporter [Lentisphaerae bacterium ADurb.Bin082]
MHWLDWLITLVPMALIMALAIYSKKYVRGVVDYLAAGRVAGRYVISVGDMASALSVITLVALVEVNYQTGFALSFWSNIIAPISIIMALTGYCVYRFRETKALSIGQFLEIRYNRPFRIFASTLRTISEMMCNAIGPAVAAKFFLYFLGIPNTIQIFGVNVSTFLLAVGIVLILALILLLPGGRISLLITDCFQGLLSYPIFVLVILFIFVTFSWPKEIAPAMLNRVPGESFLNPFDIAKLRDFNVFGLIVGIMSCILNRASWIGNDTTTSGRTPHEQKMAGLLGSWRNGFSMMMCTLIAVMIVTVMTHENHSATAHEIRQTLSTRVAKEVITDPQELTHFNAEMAMLPPMTSKTEEMKPFSRADNPDTPYFDKAASVLGDSPEGNLTLQKYKSLYSQMMLSIAMRKMLPIGLMGLFCLLMFMLLVSTDDSRIFNSSSTIVQDIIVPLRKEPLGPKTHVRAVKIVSVLVAIFFFIVSAFFVQLDYIQMFLVIMQAVWFGGAGPVMIFGLYSRFGTSAGAFASIIVGSGITAGGLILQRTWAAHIYPFLQNRQWVEPLDALLRKLSGSFEPYILWRMDPLKFPLNSYELFFLAMIGGILAYIIVSLITMREPYDLDRMLHRGIYSVDGEKTIKSPWSLRNVFSKLIGITPEYTRGDRIIAWSVFFYSIVWNVGLCFIGVLIWNLVSPWPNKYWSRYFFVVHIGVAAIIGVISTVWFITGGVIDLKRLFRDLAAREDNPLDDGRVEDNVSVADHEAIAKAQARQEKEK